MDNAPQKKNYLSDIIDYIELFVVAICIVMVLFSGLLRICTVDGTSMVPTLQDKEVLIVSDTLYVPKSGDIIVFHQTSDVQYTMNKALVMKFKDTNQNTTFHLTTIGRDSNIVFHQISVPQHIINKPLVKRVIATSGQTVSIDYKNWKVTVDGEELIEDYINYIQGVEMEDLSFLPETFTVPEGKLFVMGDNRNNSRDSRYSEIGFVDERRVLGKVIVRILPLSSFGAVD